ncbi:MAG: hypothetical protein RMY28_033070 [Nostoc sp. ChiSLP01]|nr:hypothetical protein [Nostoc sp. CmiSLP01]MDZ8289301.1 hypothetical protein [Nostoc sp. ChiSLP01]
MPLVLTSSMETEFQGLLLEDLQTIAPEEYRKESNVPVLWIAGNMRTTKKRLRRQEKRT